MALTLPQMNAHRDAARHVSNGRLDPPQETPRDALVSSECGSEVGSESERRDCFPVVHADASRVRKAFNSTSTFMPKMKSGSMFGFTWGSRGAQRPSSPLQRQRSLAREQSLARRVPTRPDSPRTSARSRREVSNFAAKDKEVKGGASNSAMRTLSKLLRFRKNGSPSCTGQPEAEAVSWSPHQALSRIMEYTPRGHGRAFAESYELGGVLGSGGFAAVREGTYKPDQEQCAVKIMNRRDILDTDALLQEVSILRQLHHPQIVRFLDFYEEPVTFFLVLEKVAGGELFDRIVSAGRFGEAEAREVVRSLLGALSYCHAQNVTHRDVKPENLLMASLDETDFTIKLADFGLARSVASGPVGGAPAGTPSYMAPETLKLEPHGTQVDCWGAGVIAHILLGGYPPFCSSRTDKLFRLIKKGRVAFYDDCWAAVSIWAKEFIVALLDVDPGTRLTAEQALRHPWIRDTSVRGDGADLELSLAKLRVFNAKRKFRAAVHTLLVCQKMHLLTALCTDTRGVPPWDSGERPSDLDEGGAADETRQAAPVSAPASLAGSPDVGSACVCPDEETSVTAAVADEERQDIPSRPSPPVVERPSSGQGRCGQIRTDTEESADEASDAVLSNSVVNARARKTFAQCRQATPAMCMDLVSRKATGSVFMDRELRDTMRSPRALSPGLEALAQAALSPESD